MNRRNRGLLVMAAGLWLAAGRSSLAADQWIEVTSPHFTVVSNNGERSARSVAWQLEQVRAAIEQAWPWARLEVDRPFVVIGAKDENTMKALAPKYWENGNAAHVSSYSASGNDRHYIAMRADITSDGPEGVNPYRESYWSYVSVTLSSSFHNRLPVWFTRGLSAVLSNTNVTDKEVQFGRSVPAYVQEFNGGRFSLTELLEMDRTSPIFSREVEWNRFDSQAWGLMHYMLFGSSDAQARETKINELARALIAGTPSAEAVAKVYGPLPALDTAYRQYVGHGMFRYMQMKADLQFAAKDFTAKPVAPPDVMVLRAGFYVATNRPVEARQAIADARALAPALAGTYDAEGLLLEHESKTDEARAAFAKAVELGSRSFQSYVRLAILTSREDTTQESLASQRQWLTHAVELNPAYAIAYQSLSNVLLRMSLPSDALPPARKAVELDPTEFYARHTLANVLLRLSQKDEALKEARMALALAADEAQRRAAQTLIDAIERIGLA